MTAHISVEEQARASCIIILISDELLIDLLLWDCEAVLERVVLACSLGCILGDVCCVKAGNQNSAMNPFLMVLWSKHFF